MNDLIITICRATRKVKLNRGFIGLNGEHLQGNIIADFTDKADFIDGVAYFEFDQKGEKYVIPMEKDTANQAYKLPILSSLLKYACILSCQVRIEQAETASGIPVFKTEVFKVPCLEAVGASNTAIGDQYPSELTTINGRLNTLEQNDEEIYRELGGQGERITVLEQTDGEINRDISRNAERITALEQNDSDHGKRITALEQNSGGYLTGEDKQDLTEYADAVKGTKLYKHKCEFMLVGFNGVGGGLNNFQFLSHKNTQYTFEEDSITYFDIEAINNDGLISQLYGAYEDKNGDLISIFAIIPYRNTKSDGQHGYAYFTAFAIDEYGNTTQREIQVEIGGAGDYTIESV